MQQGLHVPRTIRAALFVQYEWHLTPRGWILGGWCTPESVTSPTPPPDDRVETWMITATPYKNLCVPAQQQWSLVWVSSQHSAAQRRALRAWHRLPAQGWEDSTPTSWDFPLN
jgi:hypothetical protein